MQMQIERWAEKEQLKNQLDESLFREMSRYFLEEEKPGTFQYKILQKTFALVSQATEGICIDFLRNEQEQKTSGSLVREIQAVMFSVLYPLMDILKNIDNEQEYDELMDCFQWLSASGEWLQRKTHIKN